MAASTTILQHLETLISSTDHADVVLVAQAEDGPLKELPSHLAILARSPVFQRMFSGSFVEGASKRVEIPVAKVKYLEMLRQYLYTDQMDFAVDWTANDIVECMALCDKYEVPSALGLAGKLLMSRLESLALLDAEKIVDHLATAVGQEQLVRQALTKALVKVEFGSHVMQFLVWLRQFERHSCMAVEEEQMACLRKVTAHRGLLDKELVEAYGSSEQADVTQARMLLMVTYLEKVSSSLRPFVNVIPEKDSLEFGISHLRKDMRAIFASKTQSSGNNHESSSSKRQKLD